MIQPLAAGQPVVLELARLGAFDARADWIADDRIAVAVYARVPAVPAGLVGSTARVSFATPRGLHRLDAAVLAADRGGCFELAVLSAPQVDQRREHVRVAAPVPGTVAPVNAAHRALHTYTIDVSGAGVLVAGAGVVEVGDPVALTLKLPGAAEPLAVASRIVRRDRQGHVAVAFERLARAEREALVRFVFEQQRLERRARLEEQDR